MGMSINNYGGAWSAKMFGQKPKPKEDVDNPPQNTSQTQDTDNKPKPADPEPIQRIDIYEDWKKRWEEYQQEQHIKKMLEDSDKYIEQLKKENIFKG